MFFCFCACVCAPLLNCLISQKKAPAINNCWGFIEQITLSGIKWQFQLKNCSTQIFIRFGVNLNSYMLVTELMRTAEGWREIRRYYSFVGDRTAVPWTREARHPCPGCLKPFTAMAQTDHVCLGGAPDWPRLTRSKLVRTVPGRNTRPVGRPRRTE